MTHAHDRTLLAKLGFDDPDRRNPLHDAACQYLARPEIAWKVRDHLFEVIHLPTNPKRETVHFSNSYSSDNVEHRDLSIVQDNPVSVVSKTEEHVRKGEGQYSTTIGFIDVVSKFTREKTLSGTMTPPPKTVAPGLFKIESIDQLTTINQAPRGYSRICVHDAPSGHGEYSEWIILSHDSENFFCELAKTTRHWGYGHPIMATGIAADAKRTFPIIGTNVHISMYGKVQEKLAYERKDKYNQRLAIEVKAHPSTAGDVLRQIALYRAYFIADVWAAATCYPITKRDADAFASVDVKHIQLSPERVKAWAREQDAETYQAPEV